MSWEVVTSVIMGLLCVLEWAYEDERVVHQHIGACAKLSVSIEVICARVLPRIPKLSASTYPSGSVFPYKSLCWV